MSEAVLIGKFILWGFFIFALLLIIFLFYMIFVGLRKYFKALSSKEKIKEEQEELFIKNKEKNLSSKIKKVFYLCPRCGKKVHNKNKFCKHCGGKLK